MTLNTPNAPLEGAFTIRCRGVPSGQREGSTDASAPAPMKVYLRCCSSRCVQCVSRNAVRPCSWPGGKASGSTGTARQAQWLLLREDCIAKTGN